MFSAKVYNLIQVVTKIEYFVALGGIRREVAGGREGKETESHGDLGKNVVVGDGHARISLWQE